jgi:DNA polymerase delta subunit 1
MLDCDYTLGQPIQGMPGLTYGQVPIIRLYGVTEKGNSVQCNVHGFLPYFFVISPPRMTPSDCEIYRNWLNVRGEQEEEEEEEEEEKER